MVRPGSLRSPSAGPSWNRTRGRSFGATASGVGPALRLAAMTEMYRQTLPDLGLTIERATDRTPDPRRFHVFRGDELLGSHRTLLQAQAHFQRLREEAGWMPPKREEPTPAELVARDK